MDFKNWLLNEYEQRWKDVFGFEGEKMTPEVQRRSAFHTRIDPNKPIHLLDLEHITKRLGSFKIEGKEAKSRFVNIVEWGEGEGALRVFVMPDLHVEISRLGHDLEGTPTWIAKKLFLINRGGYGGNEEFIAQELKQQLKLVHKSEPDSPAKDYKGLEDLVVSMTNEIRKSGRTIFLFDHIRKVNEHQYIIKLNLRGQGVEAPDHQRVIQNETLVSFDPETGKIRATNRNIETPVGKWRWEIMPSDKDQYFFPSQPVDEITKLIATSMRWY
jgi:hypothetical protein|tara:strand:+ start:7851 stop:8663 length:813 start_codon:yes stop_codon:yes gene_type:complete